MSDLPSTPSPPEASHMDALGIAFYVMGGIGYLFSLFPVFHVAIGIAMLVNPDFWSNMQQKGQQPFPSHLIGWIIVMFGGGFIFIGFMFSTLTVVTGRYLRARKHYWFCFIVSCLKCASFPLGTILGVFSLIVLSKDSTKSLFPQFDLRNCIKSGKDNPIALH
jgi:hypothetical protein